MKIFVDTSVVLRYAAAEDSRHGLVLKCVLDLLKASHDLVYTPQVDETRILGRYDSPPGKQWLWINCSRIYKELMRSIENVMVLLEDVPEIHQSWRDLVERYDVKGKQVHDANHVAAMLAHGIEEVLTLDERDFRRYREIRIRLPQ